MLDEQTSSAVPSIPQSAPQESQYTPNARPTAPNGVNPMHRPDMQGMQALAHLYAAWPQLPGLECTVLPHGVIVGQVPPSSTPREAEFTLRAWIDALIQDPLAGFKEIDRYDGPWHWIELRATLSTQPGQPGAGRVPLTVKSRIWPSLRHITQGVDQAGLPR
jgi:hypothetical protein